MNPPAFIKAGGLLIPMASVTEVDISHIESHFVTIHYGGKVATATGLDAIEAVMLLKPSALEGLRFRWPRLGWVFHNLVAHPVVALVDVLATPLRLFGWHRPAYRFAVWFHDVTTPRPRTLS